MDEYHSRSRDSSQLLRLRRSSGDRIQYLLQAEEQLLQSIPAHTPLLEVLDRICSAINSQIGNMVSLISLPGDDVTDHAAIARIAALFGLHAFCSAGVVAENDELLGSLEMYCCVPRRPSAREFQLIERATCLAAIAIKRHNAAGHHGYCCIQGNRPVRGRVLEWPVSMN
jgi:GAF domain-containing protein